MINCHWIVQHHSKGHYNKKCLVIKENHNLEVPRLCLNIKKGLNLVKNDQ